MIAALLRRFRARKARRQAPRLLAYVHSPHRDGLARHRQALAAWEKHRP